jgi:hypothetical protein
MWKKGFFFKIASYIYLLFVLTLSNFALANKIIYVDNDAPADFNNIQTAIDAAFNGDIIAIKPGTYTGDGNRDIDFKGKAITVKSENGAQTCIIDCNGSNEDTHRGFYFHSGENTNSVLDDLTIKNGYEVHGGAIAIDSANPQIIRCTLIANTAERDGGAIWCNMSSPKILDCNISDNMSYQNGGAIFIWEGNPVISRSLLTDNFAKYDGGGINYGGNQDPTISYCTIMRNTAGDGGGIFLACGGATNEAIITHCIISDNTANWEDYFGGGIQLNGAPNGTKNGIISNCVITGNSTGILVFYGNWTITNCTVASNRNFGVFYSDSNNSLLTNSILWNNELELYIETLLAGGPTSAHSIVTHCNIEGGLAEVRIGQYNCTIEWDNSNINEYPCFVNPGYWDTNGTPKVVNDDFFVEGDYHLKSQAGRYFPNTEEWVQDDVTSPCIDTGDPNSPIGYELFPNGGYINMGAYGGTNEASKSYFGKPVCTTIVAGDINGDCKVDELDYEIMMSHWLEEH